MIPKKIYLNEEELKDNYTCERMVSCDAPIGNCNVEYTDLSQVWHDASEEPKLINYWILVLDYKNKVIVTISGYGKWRGFVKKNGIVRWAYVADILPKGGEE